MARGKVEVAHRGHCTSQAKTVGEDKAPVQGRRGQHRSRSAGESRVTALGEGGGETSIAYRHAT